MKHSSYNKLHSIEDANLLFTNRNAIFPKLASLLKEHGNNNFGVCIVHRHCMLDEGEIMVAEGNVSQPETLAPGDVYPERWLATGEAYEFTREETISPPGALVEGFRRIVGDSGILGLFYISPDKNGDMIALEKTEGRRNIIEYIPHDAPRLSIATAWRPQANTDSNFGFQDQYVILQECAYCTSTPGPHSANINKLRGLHERRDLGQFWELDNLAW